MKFLLLIFSFFSCTILCAQKNISEEIQARINAGKQFDRYALFTEAGIAADTKLGGSFKKLLLDSVQLNRFARLQPAQFEITIPGLHQNYTLKLIRSFIIDEHAVFTLADANGNHVFNYDPPLFYHGMVSGAAQKTFVTASISQKEGVHFFISTNHHNIQAGKIDDNADTKEYGNFENLPGNNESFPFSCGTNETGEIPARPAFPSGNRILSPLSYPSKVVRCFFDCAFTYYQQNGSSAGATFNRITNLFNQAALCYANESINLSISQIRVWTSADPYTHTNRDAGLLAFKNSVQDAYNGNVAMLCDWTVTNNSGLADGIAVLCHTYSDTDGPYVYNDFNYNNSFSNFPVAADAPIVYLIAHELGHIVGSPHTQWCGWSGGAIDNCAAVEGSCDPGPTPVSGTIMSYCCTNNAIGIDFNNGFGTPGNAIRDHINNSSCVGNGTGTCDSTLYLHNNITNTDFSKFEVSNLITADCLLAAGANVLLDAGNTVRLIPGFRAPQGSSLRIVNNGCGGIFRPIYRSRTNE